MKTDSQVQQDVCAELERDPSVNATWIGVEVKDGIVTLAGLVDSYAEKWSAERAALRVAGVFGIAVAIDVKPSAGNKPVIAFAPLSGASRLACLQPGSVSASLTGMMMGRWPKISV